jgi:hypothetical protein
MVRVMVESSDRSVRDRAAGLIVDVLKGDLGGKVHSEVDLTHALGD